MRAVHGRGQTGAPVSVAAMQPAQRSRELPLAAVNALDVFVVELSH